MGKYLYLPMTLKQWKGGLQDAVSGKDLEKPVNTTSIGFIEVFDNLEAVHKEYPGVEIFLLRLKED